MARSSPSCAHDDDRLRLPPASPPSSNSAEKKEPTGPRLSQLCPPCATPLSNFSLNYRRSHARIVENGFAASSGVSKPAKVVLRRAVIHIGTPPDAADIEAGDIPPACPFLQQDQSNRRSGFPTGQDRRRPFTRRPRLPRKGAG